MTLKNNRAPLLCCFQLCAWFHCHMWIQTEVRVRKRLSWVLTSVTLTFDLWPWPFAWTSLLTMVITPENFMMIRWWEHGEKGVTDGQTDGRTDGQTDRQTENTICRAAWSQLKTKGHLFHAISSFVHHFLPIGEFKLELQSGNAKLGQIQWFVEPCDLEIWRMTLKNNRAPLLCYFKLCASFRSHWWIQTRVTVRKCPIWVKFENFEPCDLEIWLITLNKANLRDLIAATGLVILLKLDSNRRFFSRETPNLGQNRRFF